jgi:hypothetical protein
VSGSRPDSGGVGAAIVALAGVGWLLLLITVPAAIFLTWWGDCFEDVCPAASDVDRAVYAFDLVAWVALPALVFGAYRGWRPPSLALLAIGVAVLAQVAAAVLGARGFQAFAIVLPAGALIAMSGFIALRPSLGGGAEDSEASATRLGLLGLAVVAILVVAIAFQSLATGVGGETQGLIVLVAAPLVLIAVLAFLNRSRRPPERPDPRRRR